MSLIQAKIIISNMTLNRLSQAHGDQILIKCWTGRELFKGSYKDPKVDQVLDANRCQCGGVDECKACDGSGYSGDFEVNWINQNDARNVYEFINY